MARQVLAIQLPVNRTALDKMIMQIKDGLFNLTDIEDIVNRTSQHIDKAKELLEKARDAKYVAGVMAFPTNQACSQRQRFIYYTV